jgi:CTP:molybdopterin cytidylyltransferase MocA
MPRPKKRTPQIQPIILAAGPPRGLPFPKALAPFGGKTALERAVETCCGTAGLLPPVIVLGCQAKRVMTVWRRTAGARKLPAVFVRNSRWRSGQMSSLLASLRRLPRQSPGFLLYPVDYPLLAPPLLERLVREFTARASRETIVAPSIGRRTGHPILVSRGLVQEFRECARRGGTARDVIYRATHTDRLLRVPVRDGAIFRDFDSPASYRRCLALSRSPAATARSSRGQVRSS